MKNYSKLFLTTLVAAGTLLVGTQFASARTFTNYEASSSSVYTLTDGDIVTNRLTTDSLYGSNTYALGLLTGIYIDETVSSLTSEDDVGKFDESVGAWIGYCEIGDNTVSARYYVYDEVALLSREANVRSQGTVALSGNNSWGFGPTETTTLFKRGIFSITDSAKWTNIGTLARTSNSLIECYMDGDSSFENVGEVLGLDWLYLRGNSTFDNRGGTLDAFRVELSENASFLNTGTLILNMGISLEDFASVENSGNFNVAYTELSGNATFINLESGEIPVADVMHSITFYLDEEGTATFQNYGNAELGSIRVIYQNENSVAKAVVENYGTMSVRNDISGVALSFINRGTITANLELVNPTLVQGSQIIGTLTLGAEAEELNLIFTGTSSDTLITGDLVLENTINLNITAEGTSRNRYSIQLWDGDLIINNGDGFATTWGTIYTNNRSYDWTLNTSTGFLMLEPKGELIVRNLKLSSGTKTLSDGNILTNYETTDFAYGKDSYRLGRLMNYTDESISIPTSIADIGKYDRTIGGWIENYEVSAVDNITYIEYSAYDVLAELSGTANVVSEGIVRVVGNGKCEEWWNDEEQSVYVSKETIPLIIMIDAAKWTNAGTLFNYLDSHIRIHIGEPIHYYEYSEDVSIFDNKGVIESFDFYLQKDSQLINTGTISDTSIKMLNSSTLENEGIVNAVELSLFDGAKVVNSGTIDVLEFSLCNNARVRNSGIINFKDSYSTISLCGNSELVNNETAEIKSHIEFNAKSAGTASFCNYGSADLGYVGFEINADEENGYNPAAKVFIWNYGTMSISDEIGINAYHNSEYYSKKLTVNDLKDKLTFVNRGVVTGNLEVETFVDIRLVQGSQITGNLSLGRDSLVQSSLGDYYLLADSETLNIILTGTSVDSLIAGDLILANTINLNVSGESISQNRYSLQVWDGDLVINGGDGFVETSGTFVVNSKTYNWSLNTSTGYLTAAIEGKSLATMTYKSLQLSSETETFIDGDFITNREIIDPAYGSDSYELGILTGLNVKNSIQSEGFSIDWDSETNSWRMESIVGGYELHYRYDSLLQLSESAQIVTTGTVTLLSNNDYSDGIYTEGIIVLAENSKWLNVGTILSEGSLQIYLSDDAIIENTGTFGNNVSAYGNSKIINSGLVVGSTSQYLFDFSSFENNGTAEFNEIVLYDNAKIINAGTIETYYLNFYGDGKFVNESTGIISCRWLRFMEEIEGTAIFQNYGNVNLDSVCFDVDATEDGYNSTVRAIIGNYGVMSVGGVFTGGIYASASDSSLVVTDLTDKLSFVNRGTISGDIDFGTFVNVTLVQGSRVEGALSLGNSVDIYFKDSRYPVSFVAESETLNVVLTGTSSESLIAGNLILGNTIKLNVSVEGELLDNYSLQLWSGSLEINKGDGFVETSGTFVVDGLSYDWSLDTSTGWLTAEMLKNITRNFISSSGTTTFIDGDILANLKITDLEFGSDSYALGVLIGVDKQNSADDADDVKVWVASENAWIDIDNLDDDHGTYRRYDAIAQLSGTAQVVTTGVVTLQGNSGNFETTKSDFSGWTSSLVVLSDSSKWTNNGMLTQSSTNSGIDFYVLNNSSFENTGTMEGSYDFEVSGTSKFINSGDISSTSYSGSSEFEFLDNSSFVNSGTMRAYVDFYDNATGTNSGTILGGLSLTGNAVFVNEESGAIASYSSSYGAWIDLDADIAGTSKFQNYGTATIAEIYFDLDLCEDCRYSADSNAIVENYGTMIANNGGSSNSSSNFSFDAWGDDPVVKLTKSDLKNRFTFVNRGIVEGNLNFDSFVNITLAGDSQIRGNVSLGETVMASYQYSNGSSSDYQTFLADAENLEVILTGTGKPALIDGDLTVANFVNLTVSVEAVNGVYLERYSQQLWSGDLLIANDHTLYSNGGTVYVMIPEELTADTAFKNTSGTFVANGVNYTWLLNVSTGMITAKSENVGEEYVAENSTDSFILGSKDVLDFGSLDEYSGMVSGTGEVESLKDLEFSGDLSNFTGTLNVSAGTLTATADSELGAGTINLESKMILEGDRVLENQISGSGTLEAAGTLTIPAGINLGNVTLEVVDDAALVFAGTRELTNNVSGDGTVVAAGTLTIPESTNLGDTMLDVAGTLIATGTRTLTNDLTGSGTLEAAGTLTIPATTALGDVALNVSKKLVLMGDRALENQVNGAGTLTLQNGNFAIASGSGALANFAGMLNVDGKLSVAGTANLGNAAIAISGTMALTGTQTVANKISGSGVLELFDGDFNLKQGLTDENLEVHVRNAEVQGPELDIVFEDGWVVDSKLEASNTIRLGAVELGGGNDLTANKIYLTGTQIAGTTTLNCHSELSNVEVTGTLAVHDFKVSTLAGTSVVNAIVDGDATGTTITIVDNSQAIISGTATVNIADCNIKLTTYGRTVAMFTSGIQPNVVVYGANATTEQVAENDKITVATPRGNGEYFYKFDENGNIVLFGVRELVQTLGYAAMPAMTIDVYNQDVKSIARNMNQRLLSARMAQPLEFNFFAEGHGNALDKDGAYEYKTYGAMVGGDWQVAKNVVVGAALGYDYGDADIDGGNDKIEMDNYRLTAFVGTEFGRKIQISGGVTVGGSSFDIKRSGEKSSVDSLNYGVFGRISTDILLTAATRIVPYVGVSAMICDFDSFSDSGAKVSDETVTSVRGTIGVAANYQMFRDLALTLDVSYTHEFCDDELDSSLDYGTGTQKISEEIGNADFATIGVGASYSLSPAARISLGYSLDIGDDLAHHANVGFSYSF